MIGRRRANSRYASNAPNNERPPRICDDLPQSLRHSAFSTAGNSNLRHHAQPVHGNTESERTRPHHSSRNNQGRIIINENGHFRILPPSTDTIYEPVIDVGAHSSSRPERPARPDRSRVHYSVGNSGNEVIQICPPPNRTINGLFNNLLEDVARDDSLSQRNSGSYSLHVPYSSDNNDTSRDIRNRKFTKFQIAVRVVLSVMVVFTVVCCISRFAEPRSDSPVTVTLISLFLTLGCFALYLLLICCRICVIPCSNEPADYDF